MSGVTKYQAITTTTFPGSIFIGAGGVTVPLENWGGKAVTATTNIENKLTSIQNPDETGTVTMLFSGEGYSNEEIKINIQGF